MRQLYPLLWAATLALAAVILLRPGGLGTLLALAAQWENVPWSDNYTPPWTQPTTTPPPTTGPSGPRSGSRPAAWPQATSAEQDRHRPERADATASDGLSPINPLRSGSTRSIDPGDADFSSHEAPRGSEPPENGGMDPEYRRSASEADPPSWGSPPNVPPPQAGVGLPENRTNRNLAPPEQGLEWGPPPMANGPQWEVSPGTNAPDGAAAPVRGNQPGPDAEWVGPTGNVPHGPGNLVKPPSAGGVAAGPWADDRRDTGSAGLAPQYEATPCEGAEILGRVGSEVILAKEVSWGIAELRAQNKDAPQDLLEAKIREILKQRVAQKIDERLIVQDAQRTIPKDNFPKIRENVAREFEASQIPRLMKATGARTRAELDALLEASGSSIEMQKNNFVDAVLANEWLRHQVKIDEDVGHQEMLDYYRQHLSEFEEPARARWEQLTVRVARFRTREEAHAALAHMGNQVLDGAPFAEVARAQSHGSTAQQGGAWDWTSQGSLASSLLDRVIFGDGVRPGIPVGALSPILEEEQAMHIIRVVEREPSRRTPFEEAQVEIKKKIRAMREAKAKQDYLARLRQQTPVWMAFDTPATASTPIGSLR